MPLPTGAGVSRQAFDAALVREAIGAGAAFLPGVSGTLLPAEGVTARRTLRFRQASHESSVEDGSSSPRMA